MANALPNPGFESNTTGWTLVGGTLSRVTTPVHSGTGAASLKKTSSSGQLHISSDGFACNPGDSVTASIWARTAATARGSQAGISWYGASGYISTDGGSFLNDSTTYQQFTCTSTAPAGATSCVLEFYINSAAVNEIHYVDDAVLDIPVAGTAGTATGSLSLTGTATSGLTFPQTVSGTVSLTGTATAALRLPATTSGAVTLTGSASAGLKLAATAAGTVSFTGTVSAAVRYARSATGTITLTGTTGAALAYTRLAAGALTLTGTTSSGLVSPGTAAGDITLTGAASARLTFTVTAAGTLDLTGTASGPRPDPDIVAGPTFASAIVTGASRSPTSNAATSAAAVNGQPFQVKVTVSGLSDANTSGGCNATPIGNGQGKAVMK
jgi:hypothetical protein